ncbi:MAG: YihY/virulence factor BrkB family protein [Gammaproteobacteria bacterium]
MLTQRWSARVEGLLFPEPQPRGLLGIGYRVLQLCWALVRDFLAGPLSLRATGLVYVTILSVVPLMGLSFAVLKAFGLQQRLVPLLADWLAPIGADSDRILARIMGFVENVQGNLLAGVGAILLILTTISMAKRVEDSLNFVWRVLGTRSLARQATDYLAVLLLGPVVMVLAMGLIASIESTALLQDLPGYQPAARAVRTFSPLGPWLLVSLAFSFVNWFIPNTRVAPWAALGGGIVGGVAWAASGVFFARFVVTSTQTLSIYAGFAIAILALIWLYLCWLTLILGAQVAFYLQHPEYLRLGYRPLGIGGRRTEQIALAVMLLLARAFGGAPQVTLDSASRDLGMPGIALDPVLDSLEAAGLLVRFGREELLLNREPRQVLVRDILAAVREPAAVSLLPAGAWPAAVTGLLGRLEAAHNGTVGNLSLEELAVEGRQAPPGA